MREARNDASFQASSTAVDITVADMAPISIVPQFRLLDVPQPHSQLCFQCGAWPKTTFSCIAARLMKCKSPCGTMEAQHRFVVAE